MKLILRMGLIFAPFVDTPKHIVLPTILYTMEFMLAGFHRQSLERIKKAALQSTHLSVAIALARKFQWQLLTEQLVSRLISFHK